MADLGDITHIMKDASVADLSWLDVDEKAYREIDHLPKQNLDISPDLEALWAHEDKPAVTYLTPNNGGPRTMADLSEAHGPVSKQAAEDISRTVRLALIRTDDPRYLRETLLARFDRGTLAAHRGVIETELQERGLLGRIYVAASDFPGCHNSPAKTGLFVRRNASTAPVIIAKPECSNCVMAKMLPTGGRTCSFFNKQIVLQVPYTDQLATAVENSQRAHGRDVQASAEADPRERIRRAFLAATIRVDPTDRPKPAVDSARLLSAVQDVAPVVLPVNLTASKTAAREAVDLAFRSGKISIASAQNCFRRVASAATQGDLEVVMQAVGSANPLPVRKYAGMGEQPPVTEVTAGAIEHEFTEAAAKVAEQGAEMTKLAAQRRAEPVIALLRREMLKGRSEDDLAQALKMAFDRRDLDATREHWVPLFKQAGLYGVVYATQDSFAECHDGVDFLSKHGSSVRAIVAGKRCEGCIYSKIGRCLLYGRALVASPGDVLTPEVVSAVVLEHRTAGRIDPMTAAEGFGADPATALRAIHKAAHSPEPRTARVPFRPVIETQHAGSSAEHITSALARREIVRTASRYLNEGLYGSQLLEALKRRFEPRDLTAATAELRPVVAEQGLQGIYYVDPTVYSDYGRGCEEAGRLFRAKQVPHVKIGSACGSCVLQTRPGFCGKLNKPLVVEPPYENKRAQQRAILATGKSTDIRYEDLVNNGRNMLAEYQFQNGGMTVDVDEAPKTASLDIEFNNQGVKL